MIHITCSPPTPVLALFLRLLGPYKTFNTLFVLPPHFDLFNVPLITPLVLFLFNVPLTPRLVLIIKFFIHLSVVPPNVARPLNANASVPPPIPSVVLPSLVPFLLLPRSQRRRLSPAPLLLTFPLPVFPALVASNRVPLALVSPPPPPPPLPPPRPPPPPPPPVPFWTFMTIVLRTCLFPAFLFLAPLPLFLFLPAQSRSPHPSRF